MLVVFSGLPGTGKTTISRLLARRLEAVDLRIDTMEPPIQTAYGRDIADVSYRMAYGVAADDPALGRTVGAEYVDPSNITRNAWRDVALRADVPAAEVEIVCSHAQTHRGRVEDRIADKSGLIAPSREEIEARPRDPSLREHVGIDIAGRAVEDCVDELMTRLPHGNEKKPFAAGRPGAGR